MVRNNVTEEVTFDLVSLVWVEIHGTEREKELREAEVWSVQELGGVTGHIGKEQRVEFACYRGCWEHGGGERVARGKVDHITEGFVGYD